jgi:tetratricopeptide (TPR) repeat protein
MNRTLKRFSFVTACTAMVCAVLFLSLERRLNGQSSSASEIEAQVREAVNLEIETQELKIKKLEADLALAKSKLKSRRANIESIVALRVRAILGDSSGQGPTAEVASVDREKAAEIAASAWALWNERKLSEALPKFKQAVQLDPTNANHWNGLGWSYINTGSAELALPAFKKAVEIESGHLGARNGIGQSYLALGKLDLAEEELLAQTKSLIEAQGERAAAEAACWYGLVRVYIGMKEKEKAIEWAERLLKIKPNEEMMTELLKQAKSL